jgi:hypothetical protein
MCDLVDYRVAYGECVGYCTSILTVHGPRIELTQTANLPNVDARRFTGEIEAGLSQAIVEAAASLEQGNLRDVYGTPDARDEGAVTVRLRGRSGVTDHSYSRGSPPAALVALDALLSPIVLGWIDHDPPAGVRFDDTP